jgi:uncharacterized protein
MAPPKGIVLYSGIAFVEASMPGKLSERTLKNLLAALPLDITYVDEADVIRYYSDYRIFNRAPEIIGTTVQNCHSPASRPEVDKVIDDLRSGRKTVSEFDTEKNGRKVKVRYIAVKDEKGKYAGMVETAEWAD